MECLKNKIKRLSIGTSIEETELMFENFKPSPMTIDVQPANMNYDNRRFLDLKSPKKLYKRESKSFYWWTGDKQKQS